MAVHLFPGFLDDPAQYAAAEDYWRQLWDELMGRAGQREGWIRPWLQTAYANGTPFRDGDPIFSAWSPSRKLGVRVIQNRPEGVGLGLDFWTDTFGDEWSGEVRVLVIACELSSRTADLARELIGQWVRTGEASLSFPPVGRLRLDAYGWDPGEASLSFPPVGRPVVGSPGPEPVLIVAAGPLSEMPVEKPHFPIAA